MSHDLAGTPGPEGRLLLCCARSRPDPHALRRAERLLAGGIDWTLLTRLALANRVTPLLDATLRRLDRSAAPTEFLEALQSHCETNHARGRLLQEELLEILAALEGTGVPALPFKGVTLARRAYGDVALRWAGDIDLLVHREDIERVDRALRARGYLEATENNRRRTLDAVEREWILDHDCEFLYKRREDDLWVEPHWALVQRRLAITLDYDGIWKRAAPLRLEGRTVPVFSVEDLMLALAVHGSKHRWAELRWCCDIAELARRSPELDWAACMARAERAGCRRMLSIGLLLAADLLDAPLPDRILRSQRADRHAAALAGQATLRMFDAEVRREPPSGLSAFRFRMRERWRDRASYVLRSITTPSVDQARRLPLPRSLRFLHFAIRPFVDLVLDPLRRVGANGNGDGDGPPGPPMVDQAAWARTSTTFERWAGHHSRRYGWLNEQLADRARVAPGGQVLDLASGIGEPALHVARRTGETGAVVGVDASLEMLAVARDRGAREGARNLRLCAAAMEELPFRSGSFDAVVCRFGLGYASRVDAVLAGAFRVLRSRGPAVFLVWGPRANNTLAEIIEQAIASFFGDTYAPPVPDRFRFARPGSLGRALGRAGFTEIGEHDVRRTESIPDPSDDWRAHYETIHGDWVARLPGSVQRALEERIAARVEAAWPGVPAGLETHARIVVGRKP